MKKILKKLRGLKTIPKLIMGYFLLSLSMLLLDIDRVEILEDVVVLYYGRDYILIFCIILLFLYWIFYGSLYKEEYLEIVKQKEEVERKIKEEKRKKKEEVDWNRIYGRSQ
jgi:hypothetical protein